MASKTIKNTNDIAELRTAYNSVTKELETANKKAERSEELARRAISQMERHLAQFARKNFSRDTHSNSENVELRDVIYKKELASGLETAASIIEWDGIPKKQGDFLDVIHSKKIERKMLYFPAITIFFFKGYWRCLPFTANTGSLDDDNEFTIIKPYSPSGGEGSKPRTKYDFGEFTVGKDCVILSDYYVPNETQGSFSFNTRLIIELYSKLIADCEMTKITNRNWLKIPLLFSTEDSTPVDKNSGLSDIETMMLDIKKIIQATNDNEFAVLTRYAKNLVVHQTKIQFAGKELDETIRNYRATMYNELGIDNVEFQKGDRLTQGETNYNSDRYNINVSKRLMNRQRALDQLKKIEPNFWGSVSLKVNLNNFGGNYIPKGVDNESE